MPLREGLHERVHCDMRQHFAKRYWLQNAMQECKDEGMKPLDLIWVDTDRSVDPTHKNIRSRLQENTRRRSKESFSWFSVVLCNATS